MKKFWHYLKQQAWFMALPLLFMTAYGTSALAAQAPSFSATASGAANNLSVTADINVGDADVGKMGNNYVGFNFNQTWYFHNGAGWASFNSGAVPIYAAAPLANRAIEVLRNQDVSGLIGGQLYVGYGLTESDMLANNKFGMVYTVTDTTAPTVTNTIHANGATNVATNTKVAVAFSETMDSSTINDANFTLKETVSGIAVTGIVSYSGVTATFIPIGNLAGNTGYTVTVKGGAHGAKDLAGNPLASDFSIAWTTGAEPDVTAPTVTGTPHTNGATNVAVNTKIGATFSEGMDPLTITNANFTLKETVSGNAVAGTVSYSGVSAVFVPSSILARSTGYTVTVKGGSGGVKDLAGNPLASDFAISWTTAATTDTIAPTVTGIMHANGATNVAYNTKVGIAFSEGMDPLTVTNLNFALKETVSGKPVAGTVSYSGTNATFIPTTGLAGFTGYTVTIKGGAGGVKDLAGNPLASDFVIGWTTGAAPDTTAPTVTGTINANNANGVAINTKIGAIFSEAMDPLTITNVNFTLKDASGNAVAGTVSYSGVSTLFIPLNSLSYSTRYTVTIKGGVDGAKDLAGNPLASDFVISWTTAGYCCDYYYPPVDSTPPTVTGTINADGAVDVAINTAVGATFSEAMDHSTMTNVIFTLKGTAAPFTAVPGTVTYSGVNAVFTPLTNLASNTSYTATIKGGGSGAKDLAGNALAGDKVWSWTTAANIDATAPTVSGTVNLNGDVGVAINTKVGASFSEAMDPLTITNVNFTLKETISGNAVTGTVDYSSVNATFIPSSNLAPSTQYTATIKGGITGVKDLASNPLAVDKVWSFTTGAGTDAVIPTAVVSPADAATGVAVNSTVTATFSEAMDHMTITSTTFTLHETATPLVPIAGTITYDPQTSIATFTPSSNLANNTAYTATVTIGAKDMAGNALAVDKVWSFTTAGAGPAAVSLLTAGNFAILTKAAITDVPSSPITGDVGASPITAAAIGVTCAEMDVASGSKIYGSNAAYPTAPDCYQSLAADISYVGTAVTHMEAAYTNAAGRAAGTGAFLNVGGGTLTNQTLVPGVYTFNGAGVTIPTDLTLAGGANDVWIFQITGTLDIANSKQILLSGGAQAKNIFWQVAGTVTLQGGSHFEGTILAQTNIQMVTGATINGRLLAQTDVALDHNTVIKPAP